MIDIALVAALAVCAGLLAREHDRRKEAMAGLFASDARNERLTGHLLSRPFHSRGRDRWSPKRYTVPAHNWGPTTDELHEWGWMKRSTTQATRWVSA